MSYSITYPMNALRSIVRLVPSSSRLLVVAVGLAAACTPLSEQEKAYYAEREREREEEQEQARTLTNSATVNEAVDLVRRTPDPETLVTWDDWLRGELAKEAGRVMFGRWQVLSRGRGQVQVRYEYSVMHPDYTMDRKGWAWDTNLPPLPRVARPRALTEEELGLRRDGDPSTTVSRRSSLDDFTLE
jgi:hypothetical protein